MSDRILIEDYSFDSSDNAIHELAAAFLLSREDSEIVLAHGGYLYKVKGGRDGYLFYRKGNRDWVLIANWCFYGLYIVVRYRKPVWLRPMYRSLFAKMNFVSVNFNDSNVELVGTSGEILRSRRFRLTPPAALEQVMSEKLGYSPEKVKQLKVELNL